MNAPVTITAKLTLPEHRSCYYGGAWHAPLSARGADTINPGTGETLGKVADAGTTDVDAAVAAAKGAFKQNIEHRDGHISAEFDASGVDITGSSLAQRKVSEEDRMGLFGHLLIVAIERGLRPAELLAIGMAIALQNGDAELKVSQGKG